jgi:hypothetical protein
MYRFPSGAKAQAGAVPVPREPNPQTVPLYPVCSRRSRSARRVGEQFRRRSHSRSEPRARRTIRRFWAAIAQAVSRRAVLLTPAPPSTTNSPPRPSNARIVANSAVRSISLIKQAIVVREICYVQRPRSYHVVVPFLSCRMWYARRSGTPIERGPQTKLALREGGRDAGAGSSTDESGETFCERQGAIN